MNEEKITKKELLQLLDAVGVEYYIDESTPPVFQDIDGRVMPLDEAPSVLEMLANANIFDEGDYFTTAIPSKMSIASPKKSKKAIETYIGDGSNLKIKTRPVQVTNQYDLHKVVISNDRGGYAA